MPSKIVSDLFGMRDEKFAKFNASLMPTSTQQKVIGVRTPDLRKYAKTISNPNKFLSELPHKYFEENQIHAFILSDIRDFEKCVKMVDAFLPYIDNWATCDQLIPKTFSKNLDKLLPHILKWIKSKHTYSVRFAIGLLMRFYLGDNFDSKYANMVVSVASSEYYINMMRAWYFATALAKNWDDVISIIENKKLDTWTHNKTIQKANESFRITPAKKRFLTALKI
ncbi:MAG: DNA alkylation repair protein [Alphaproteobacteria bacterium]|nr:DNA alkylation repair protein [Alphaproteobacteria bacterium]